MMMLRHASLKLIACCLALSACVTINVYFPAAAAEKAADKIIEDVWGGDK
jgi:predicted aminopeptidase